MNSDELKDKLGRENIDKLRENMRAEVKRMILAGGDRIEIMYGATAFGRPHIAVYGRDTLGVWVRLSTGQNYSAAELAAIIESDTVIKWTQR